MVLGPEEFSQAEIDFQHDYYKLDLAEFSTVRGKSKFEKYSVGQIIKITKRGQCFCTCSVTNKELKRICDMTLEFLKKDGEYPGFIINSHQDFVDLINSFRKHPYMPKADVDSLMSIFYLVKVL